MVGTMTPPDDTDEAEIYVKVCIIKSLERDCPRCYFFAWTCHLIDEFTFVERTQGKRKMVDGFVRWCKKGDVGLSQQATVSDVKDEEPTGLYDGFYAKTKQTSGFDECSLSLETGTQMIDSLIR